MMLDYKDLFCFDIFTKLFLADWLTVIFKSGFTINFLWICLLCSFPMATTQSVIACPKLEIETPKQGVKYVQS